MITYECQNCHELHKDGAFTNNYWINHAMVFLCYPCWKKWKKPKSEKKKWYL